MFYWSNCGCPEKYATGDFDSDKMRSQIDEAGEEKKRQDGSKFNFQRKEDKDNFRRSGLKGKEPGRSSKKTLSKVFFRPDHYLEPGMET